MLDKKSQGYQYTRQYLLYLVKMSIEVDPELKAGVYEHYTGLISLVIGLGRDAETEALTVVYIPLGVKKGPRISHQRYERFFEEVEVEGVRRPRHRHLGSTMPEELAKQYLPLSR